MTTRAELSSFVGDLKTKFLQDPRAVSVETAISAKLDDVIREIWGPRQPLRPFALIAIGGYGRGTIHPESDIDLLFFFKDVIEEETIKAVLHPLWDLPFRVGHQIRHAPDFAVFDQSQMESYTAFLDSRYLAGDFKLAEEFQKGILPQLIHRHRDRFARLLAEMKDQRYRQFGHTIYQLEPDLKEAPGGLRDLHWSNWVRKALDRNDDEPSTDDVFSFHHCIRNFLHFHSNRNFNVLSYEFQEQIALWLGYADSARGEAAENLMRDYFLRAGDATRRAAHWEEAIEGSPNRLVVPEIPTDPFELIAIFGEAHRTKAKLDSATLASVRQKVASMNGSLGNNPRAGQAVLEMMKDRRGIYESLLVMHEVGLLGKIFPDFEEIRCRVIRDFFHKYTVDEHSLIAIRNIEELPERHRFSTILNQLEHPELLLMSLLFHDIGKSHRHDEGNHVHPSTEGVKVILEKIQLPQDQAERIIFVIKNHLEMSKIILRRDFSDEQVIDQFADMVGDVENLRMLCLLTYADVKAVNNEVLTPWKEDLLWQLYIETYNRLTLGLADDVYHQQPVFEKEIEAIVRLLPRGANAQDIRDFLDGFPRRYLKSTPLQQIAEHFLLSRKLSKQPMAMHLSQSGSVYELLVMTADRPFLFSKITGVLTYFGMNIVRAQAFSNRHGAIFDLIAFEDSHGNFAKNPTEIERMTKVLNDVVNDTVALDKLLRGKMTSVLFRNRKGLAATSIHFDNEFSSRCTIMEISAQDAFGLLYQIATVISKHGCNIEVALIATEGPRAIDVFYLTRNGRKLEPELQAEIQQDLNAAIPSA
jgi:[protein-PII] uridylyltransferase